MALNGYRVLEFAGLAPAPVCGMILADFGANVIRIDKVGVPNNLDVSCRGKRSISVNLKHPKGINIIKRLAKTSDVLIEPFRPGVMEKLGLGPESLFKENKGLIYTRMSGYGQTGPWSQRAGHDINYLALSGLLSMFGRANSKPTPPVNLAADFAGGSLLSAFAIVSALLGRNRTGNGMVLDANMTSGAAYVGSWMYLSHSMTHGVPIWGNPRGENLLDSGYPLYDTYETGDGTFMSVGALEPAFASHFLQAMGLDMSSLAKPRAELSAKIAQAFKQQPRSHWERLFSTHPYTDACVAPVLELDEVGSHEHNEANQSFVQTRPSDPDTPACFTPARAPKFTHLDGSRGLPPMNMTEPVTGEHSLEILDGLGYTRTEIKEFMADGIVEGPENTNSKL